MRECEMRECGIQLPGVREFRIRAFLNPPPLVVPKLLTSKETSKLCKFPKDLSSSPNPHTSHQ